MTLSGHDKNRLFDFYGSSLKNHGSHSAKALHWISSQNQEIRFGVLCRDLPLSDSSVLDFGCGVGDLHPFINQRFHNVRYLGIDILPDMVREARAKYPDGNFWSVDVFDIDAPFDYLLASGAFTFNVQDGMEFYLGIIAQMFKLAKKMVVFNMLDSEFESTTDEYLSYDKNEVAEFCRTLTPNFKIITGYNLGDFTVTLKKQSPGLWSEN
jgi:cyclopropane fatty-acyl-phospholipid synthase-like methyltransferase